MKKPTKLTLIALLLALVMVMSVVVAACKDDDSKITEEEAKDTLQYYILSTNTAENDFTLPKVIGKTDDFPGIEVVWTSSDTKVIEIEDREGETYLAKVNQDSSAHAVTLTVKHKDTNASKDFTVTVPAFSVYSFTENYTFTRNGAVVSADFNLDTTYTFKGRDCTIVWTITELTLVVGEESSSITVADNQYVAIQDGVFKVKATPEEGYVDVKVNAKFTYNGENVDKPFGFKVQEAKDPQEENFVWYSEAGTVRAISGYVVGIATPFTTQNNYNNASIYVVTDDLSGGVYLFRTKGSVEDGALLEPGVHVTVSGVTSTEYVATGTEAPGLWETTQGSNFVIDGEKADVSTLVYALDNDATSGSPALKWHTGALVSLTNWKVKTVKEASTSKSGTLVTLEKDGAEIDISYSNYMEGFYTSEESNVSAELKAIKDEVAKYKEGDYVSVVGILSYFSGSHHFQILPRDAKDIKAGTADTTPTAGSKVTPAIKKVEEEFAKNVSGIVASPLNFAMPTSENGVTITYTVMGRNAPVAVDEQGNWTITPAKSDKRNIKVTYTVDKYVTYSFLTVRSESLTDEDKVAKAIKTIEGKLTKDFTEATDYTLPVDTDFGTTVVWTIKESDKTFAKIENGVLKVTLPQTESTFTLVLKVTLGQVEDSKEYTVTVAAAPTTVTTFTVEPMSEGDHYIGVYQSTLGKWYYGTTAKDSFYVGTTDDPSLAEKWTLAKVSGSDTLYTIKVGDLGYLEKDESDGAGESYIKLNAQPTEGKGWSWDAEHQAIVWTKADGSSFYLGNYGEITHLRTSSTTRLGTAGNNIAAFGSITVSEVGPQPEPEVNHGTEEAPLTVAEFLALTDLPTGSSNSDFDVWVKGYVVKSVQGPSKGEYNLYITDQKGNAGTTVQIYWAACDQQPFIGDFIVVNGYVKKYNDSYELTKNNNASNTNVITIKERSSDAVSVEIVENENATLSADKQSGTNGQQIVITAKPNQGYDFVKLTVEGVEITATNADGNYIAYIGDYDGDSKTTIELTVKLHVEKTYTLVESTDVLVEGAVVVFAYKYTSGDTTSIWMAGEMSGSILSVIKDAATLSADGKSLSQVNLLVQEFTIGKTDGHYTFAIDGNLLGITSTGNGKLSTSDSNRTSTWDITIADGVATILSTVIDDGKDAPTCKLQCNTNSGQERFANYKTGSQKDFQLFLVEEAE